ncbi:MAG: twin-arginine translocase TatA/TatE family subunit [Solirubrobacterales bacterium]
MFGILGNVGPWELILILAIALIIFGPGKLPDVGKSLGKGINEFRRASNEVQREISEAVKLEEPKDKTV